MKQLTKAEEQVMQVLWELEKGFVKDIIEVLPEPKPAYNTISTIVRILEKKGFVDHNTYGKTHEYYPLMTKEEYSQKYLNNFVQGYFGNSFKQLVSFFTKQENLSLNEIEDIMKILEEEKKKKDGDR
jgi:predicted transcriptional regulator